MAIGLCVKVLSPDVPGGWRDGVVDAISGQVVVSGTTVAPSRVWGIRHDYKRQMPHEAPSPAETGWWILIAAMLFPDALVEVEATASPEWREPIASAARALASLGAQGRGR